MGRERLVIRRSRPLFIRHHTSTSPPKRIRVYLLLEAIFLQDVFASKHKIRGNILGFKPLQGNLSHWLRRLLVASQGGV